jgi:hypothetical protein
MCKWARPMRMLSRPDAYSSAGPYGCADAGLSAHATVSRRGARSGKKRFFLVLSKVLTCSMQNLSAIDSGLSKVKKLLSSGLNPDHQSTHIFWGSNNDLYLVGLDPAVLKKINELIFDSLSRVVEVQKNAIIADVVEIHLNTEGKFDHVSSFRLSLLPLMIDKQQKDNLADSVRIEIHAETCDLLKTNLKRILNEKSIQILILKAASELCQSLPKGEFHVPVEISKALRILNMLELKKHHDTGSCQKKMNLSLFYVFLKCHFCRHRVSAVRY